MSRPVRSPAWSLSIAGADVTRSLEPMVLSITYTDHAEGQSDEVAVSLENADGRWADAWRPGKGDRLTLAIGYAGETMLPCGDFEIDDLNYSGPPDKLALRAIAAGIRPALRSRNTQAYEDTDLAGIAAEVGARHGLTVVGAIESIPLGRVTQDDETDLGFLRRVAKDYDHVFSVRGNKLIVHKVADLEAQAPAGTIRRTDVASFHIRDKATGVYRAATVRYHEPDSHTVREHTETAGGVAGGDTLKITERAENTAQARSKARAALAQAIRSERTASLTLEGRPDLAAGGTVTLEGFGLADGKYLIETSRHTLQPGQGYQTAIDVRAVLRT